MAQLVNGQVQYGSGEALPNVGSSAYVASQNGQINPLNSYTGATPSPATAPINSSTITPQSAITVTSPVPATGYTGLSGAIGAQAQQFTADQAAAKAEADKIASEKAKLDASTTSLKDRLFGQQTQSGLTSDAYSTVNSTGSSVNTAQKELNDINNQILAEQVAAKNQIEQVQKAGGFKGAIDEATARITRESVSKQADLAVIQMAKQNNFALAKDIADRNVQASLEQQKNELDALKFDYQNNKDQYTKDEQRQFDAEIKKKDRAYQEAYDAKQKLSDTKLEVLKAANDNGAPTSVLSNIQQAGTPEDALIAAGSYGRDQLKQLQIAKAKADLANAQQTNQAPSLEGVTQDYSSFLQSRTPEQVMAFNSMPVSDKASVAQLVSGNALLTDIVKSRGVSSQAQINKIIQEATAVDPTFSINNNKVKYTFMQGWNNPNGKASMTRNALNTALGHLADFKTNADALDPGSINKLNNVKNILSTETGDPKVLRLRTDINALATEVATAYKGGQPTESEIHNWEETIAADFSKSQFQGVSDELTKLLSSKITASRYQFKNTMGYEYGQSIIDPEKKDVLLKAGIDPSVFPFENTGNPQDNPFGQSLGATSTDIYSTSTNMFNIPTTK